MRNTIDLNCGVGETSFENDAQLLPLVSSCNVSCGAHAGDMRLITNTVLPSGQCIVVLQDGQATGGYPRIAYLPSPTLRRFNQLRVHEPFAVRF